MTNLVPEPPRDSAAGLPPTDILEFRLRAYFWLARKLRYQNSGRNVLLLASLAEQIPLLVVGAYLFVAADAPFGSLLPLIVATLVALLLGMGILHVGLWVMTAPLASGARALNRYRDQGVLPDLSTDIDDEAGRLLLAVHQTIGGVERTTQYWRQQARNDHLTGLLNRAGGEARMHADVEQARAAEDGFVIMMVDLDGLKDVNDAWGHGAGDMCLRHLADVIAHEVNGHGWVARWGGDEFLLSLPMPLREAEDVLGRLRNTLSRTPVTLGSDRHVPLSVSAGLAWVGGRGDLATGLAQADADLYLRKRQRAVEPVPRRQSPS